MSITLRQKKKFCISNVNFLNMDEKKLVGNVLMVENAAKVHEGKNDCRVDLDQIDEQTINTIYNLIKQKLDKIV